MNNQDAAATTWCELAKAAYEAGNGETLVENTKGARPYKYGSTTSKIASVYFKYHSDDNFNNCVADVKKDIEVCLPLSSSTKPEEKARQCSPNHVHSSKS